jgi:hypothetical protein
MHVLRGFYWVLITRHATDCTDMAISAEVTQVYKVPPYQLQQGSREAAAVSYLHHVPRTGRACFILVPRSISMIWCGAASEYYYKHAGQYNVAICSYRFSSMLRLAIVNKSHRYSVASQPQCPTKRERMSSWSTGNLYYLASLFRSVRSNLASMQLSSAACRPCQAFYK